MASACSSIMPDAAGPQEAQELQERMACLRKKIEAPGGARHEEVELLARKWLRLASLKVDLVLSGLSESDRSSPKEFSAILKEDDAAEATSTRRRPTWQEWLALEKRLRCLLQQNAAAAADEIFAGEVASKVGVAATGFLRKSKECQRALGQAYLRLARTKRDPDFSGMSESDRAAEAERLRQERLQEADRLLQEEGVIRRCRQKEGEARILDFDPKQGGIYFNSLYSVDLATFDHTEESPIGPMRFTDRVSDGKMSVHCAGINILSVKIACSDIDFPIQVYGTVIARDCIDYKRVYLFCRDSDHCQLVNSIDEELILTGPKRGLALEYHDDYVETDLWVKDYQGHCREFSKGILRIRGTATQSLDKCERISLASRLSTVDVVYDIVKCPVEATIAIEVLQGKFYGVITAHTATIERIVLYDSKVSDGNCHAVIQLMRPVVSVNVMDKLVIIAKTDAGDYDGLRFNPYWNGGAENILNLGDTTMCVKVAWSMMDT